MLTLKLEELDDDTRMIVQAIRLRMLKRLKEQLETTEKETDEKARRKRMPRRNR